MVITDSFETKKIYVHLRVDVPQLLYARVDLQQLEANNYRERGVLAKFSDTAILRYELELTELRMSSTPFPIDPRRAGLTEEPFDAVIKMKFGPEPE